MNTVRRLGFILIVGLLLGWGCGGGAVVKPEKPVVSPPATTEAKPWELVEIPLKVALRAVYFANDNIVFAVGDKGTIIISRDKGKHWEKQSPQSKADLCGVHFIDKDHGWACGDGDPDAPGARGHIVTGRTMKCSTCLITSDGGNNWETVWVHTNFELRSIWMASPKVGQICNHGTELHPDGDSIITCDGARTWRQESVYRGLNDCCWISEKEGWAVGSAVSVGFVPTPTSPLYTHGTARIIHTSDGGKNWQPQDTEDIKGQLRSIWFVDSQFGCTVGDAGTIFITSNGGKDWTLCEKVTNNTLYAVCFTSKSNGWAVGKKGEIVKTTDGGKTWGKEPSPAKTTFYGLHFSEKDKIGIAVGAKGTIIRFQP